MSAYTSGMENRFDKPACARVVTARTASAPARVVCAMVAGCPSPVRPGGLLSFVGVGEVAKAYSTPRTAHGEYYMRGVCRSMQYDIEATVWYRRQSQPIWLGLHGNKKDTKRYERALSCRGRKRVPRERDDPRPERGRRQIVRATPVPRPVPGGWHMEKKENDSDISIRMRHCICPLGTAAGGERAVEKLRREDDVGEIEVGCRYAGAA